MYGNWGIHSGTAAMLGLEPWQPSPDEEREFCDADDLVVEEAPQELV